MAVTAGGAGGRGSRRARAKAADTEVLCGARCGMACEACAALDCGCTMVAAAARRCTRKGVTWATCRTVPQSVERRVAAMHTLTGKPMPWPYILHALQNDLYLSLSVPSRYIQVDRVDLLWWPTGGAGTPRPRWQSKIVMTSTYKAQSYIGARFDLYYRTVTDKVLAGGPRALWAPLCSSWPLHTDFPRRF